MYFSYGEKEINYLKSRDKKLGEVIDKVGHINRPVDNDLFSSVIHHIIGQQISSKAQASIWGRMQNSFNPLNHETIANADINLIQNLGISYRKAEYIKEFAEKVCSGFIDLEKIRNMPDAQAISQLTSLRGVGIWTAEMILLFCLERPDILSYNDLAIQRGLCILYHHKKIKRELFKKYQKRYSPCGSVASLYLWAVAGGNVEC